MATWKDECVFVFINLVVAMSNTARTSTNYWYDTKGKRCIVIIVDKAGRSIFSSGVLLFLWPDIMSPMKKLTQ